MRYTEAEAAFLSEGRPIYETRGSRTIIVGEFKRIVDIRALGCPEALYEKLLDQRAHKIRKEFAEFRSGKPAATVTRRAVEVTTSPAPLAEVFGTKLF
jgi:hypothetical protein